MTPEEYWRNTFSITIPHIDAKMITSGNITFSETKFWKDAKIYRNGIHTTVKWSDGSITRVKAKEGEELDDTEAFINALANKLYGSRSAVKRFVQKNTVDVGEKKRKKNEKRKAVDSTKICDSKGQELHIGDKVYIELPEDYLDSSFTKDEKKEFFDTFDRKIFEIEDFSEDGRYMAFVNMTYVIQTEYTTKVKTGYPFKAGDYIVISKPEVEDNYGENYGIGGNAWDVLEQKPLQIETVGIITNSLGVTITVEGEEFYFYIKPEWVRKS